MNVWMDKYESVSNAGSLIAVALVAAVALVLLLNDRNVPVISGITPSVIVIEYSEFFEKASPSAQTAEEVFAEEIIPDPVVKKNIEQKEVKKQTKVSEEKAVSSEQQANSSPIVSDIKAVDLSAHEEFLSYFLGLVQKSLYYPRNARKAGITGIVEIKVTFTASGEIKNFALNGKKHSALLGDAALKTMEQVRKDWRPLLNPQKEQSVIIPVSFELK